MKKLFLSLPLALLSLTAGAQSLDYLTLQSTEGVHTSFPIDGLKLYVEGAQLRVASGETQATFNLADLSAMFFAQTSTTAIANDALAATTSVKPGANGLVVTAPKGAVVRCYAADGRLAAQFVKTSDGGETLGETLSAGVYVVNVNGETFKVLMR